MFPNYIWNFPTDDKILYLTFDDGPTPEITNWTLDILNSFNAKATFFCIGNNVEKHPDIFKNILDNGHRIGNHTHQHLKGWNVKTKPYLNDIEIASNFINSNLFRPPYGKLKTKQAKALIQLKYKIIMWDVLSFDWDHTITNEQCYNGVISKAKNGSIIVFHDSIKAENNMKYTLPKVLKYFSEKGYQFKSIDF